MHESAEHHEVVWDSPTLHIHANLLLGFNGSLAREKESGVGTERHFSSGFKLTFGSPGHYGIVSDNRQSGLFLLTIGLTH